MKKRSWIVLIATIAVFFLSMWGIYATLTSGYTVDVRSVDFITDDGVNLNATLYVPANATAETPAAGVLVCPGGNTPHTFYASYSIELARRGYVVLAYDYYGTVSSDMASTGSSGAIAAMKYLTGLSFVDETRLVSTGHSNGGGQAYAAITSEYASSAVKKSVVFIGCGISATDLSTLDGINVCAVWGKIDECGQGTFWDVCHQGSYNFSTMCDLTGTTSETIEPGKWYGSVEDSNARIVYTPNTFHSMSNITPSSVSDIITFIDTTIDGNVNGIASTSHIYIWQEIFVLIAALSLCVMIFPVGSIILETGFFSSIKRPVPEAQAKMDWKFWVFLIVPAILCALLVKSTVIQGQTLLGKLPNFFKVQSTNGFIWWFFLSALITIAAFIIRMFVEKADRKAHMDRLRIGGAELGKTIIAALVMVGVPYACAVFGERSTGWYGRIFQTYFAPISANRITMFPVYFVMFAVLFCIYSYCFSDGLRIKGAKPAVNYVITLIAYSLPALIFLVTLYGKLIITRVTPINGREMSRAQGAMMGMILLYFVIAAVNTKFYKKTGNVYLVGLVNAAFVTWLSVNTPQLMV